MPDPASSPHWVELRIHGVSGTPPEVMLESAHVRQVAGDSWGRYFRCTDGVGEEIHPQPPGIPADRLLEGYHWGKYTSGSWVKGLWLILVPFGLVNAAAFMLPTPVTPFQHTLHKAAQSILRSIAMGVTATFALAAGLITVDLLASQWVARFDWLEKFGVGHVLSLGVMLGGALIAGLFALGNQIRASLFSDAPPSSVAGQGVSASGLTRTAFFQVDLTSAPVLGQLHLAGGWCVVTVIGTLSWDALTPAHAMPTQTHVEHALRVGSLVLLGLLTLVAAVAGDVAGAVTGSPLGAGVTAWLEKATLLALLLSGIGLACAGGLLVYVHGTANSSLDFDTYAQWLATLSWIALGGLAITTWWLGVLTPPAPGTPPTFKRYARGMGCWAATSAGVFLAVGFSSAFVLGLAKALGARADAAFLHRVSYSWGLTAILAVGIGACLLTRWWWRGLALVQRATHAYDEVAPPLTAPPGDWPKRVARAMSTALLKFSIAPPMLGFAFAGLAMTIVTSVELLTDRGLPVLPFGWLSQDSTRNGTVPTYVTLLTNLGTVVLIGLAGLLFAMGRRSLRAEQTRRGANVLWDVISFWPHSAHPFVPPAYSQFAVQDVRRRVAFHLTGSTTPRRLPADSLVISAHSQGSLVTLAALLWLPQTELDRIGLVTYGSQLQVAYPRGFPAFVDQSLLEEVQKRLRWNWVNLYRDTDPIAGPVLSWGRSPIASAPPSPNPPRSRRLGVPIFALADTHSLRTGRRMSGHDWRVLDPPPVDPALMLSPLTHLSAHSGYPGSLDYPDAVTIVKR